MTNNVARKQLFELVNAYRSGCLLGAAAELDLFTPVLDTPMTAKKIAEIRKTDLRGTQMVLDALSMLGVYRKNDNTYVIADDFRELLDPMHRETFIPMIRHQMRCMRQWTRLAWAVKNGKPEPREASILGKAEDDRSFILAMESIGISQAKPLIEKMHTVGLTNFRTVLDVGGASGTYIRAFFEVNDQCEAVIFDLPHAIEEARQKFRGDKNESRVKFVTGDFYKDELPHGADFVWLSAIIHQHDRAATVELYKKIERALVPGGKIAVRDHVLNEDRTAPADGVLFAINMLANTENGMCYTFNEIREDLKASGFENIEYAVQADNMCAIVTATKKV